MDKNRLPQITFYGEMKKRHAHGPKKRWRDLVSIDLQNLNLLSDSWQDLCLDRESWYSCYLEGISQLCTIEENLCAVNNQPLDKTFPCP